jgi:alkylhydroperoxidase/carboxymuconolactone decarboxylase family protein YurZ
LLLQQAIYAGVPVANTAFNEARAVIEEMGKKIGSKP